MNDPGSAGYVLAYERVLALGVPALLEDVDGVPRVGSCDITENLLLSHNAAPESVSKRWFSVLAACIELFGASDYCYAPFSRTLTALLVDSFALDAGRVPGAPLELLPLVCRELQQSRTDKYERTIALLGELLTARLSYVELESKCRELHALHEEFQQWYAEDGGKNLYFAERAEFIWGALRLDRGMEATWLELVERHFPSSPELARGTRERLLRDGSLHGG